MTVRHSDALAARPRWWMPSALGARAAQVIVALALVSAGVFAASSAIAQAPAPAPADSGGYVEGEKTLEGRLLAPCCWAQTLDIHESEISTQLRKEIRQRLMRGESQASIEQDMVARYGEKIRAVPEGKSLTGMGVWLSVLFGVAGIGAAALVVRWVRKGPPRNPPGDGGAGAGDSPRSTGDEPAKSAKRDEWDERLDDELRDVDD